MCGANIVRSSFSNWQPAYAMGKVAAEKGAAAPAFMSALAYYDGYRSARLPANLLQARTHVFQTMPALLLRPEPAPVVLDLHDQSLANNG